MEYPQRLQPNPANEIYRFKRMVRWYQNRAIMLYFPGSEIIMEPKVCVILRYLLIKIAHNIQGQVGRLKK